MFPVTRIKCRIGLFVLPLLDEIHSDRSALSLPSHKRKILYILSLHKECRRTKLSPSFSPAIHKNNDYLYLLQTYFINFSPTFRNGVVIHYDIDQPSSNSGNFITGAVLFVFVNKELK